MKKRSCYNELNIVDRRDFCYASEKGQTFNRYSDEIKKEAVRLRVEEGWTYTRIMEKFGIKSESQIITWVRKSQNGESDRKGISLSGHGDQVVGVLHRVPANVVGDGVHTIEQLVHEKNKDPLRGKGYKTPLRKFS